MSEYKDCKREWEVLEYGGKDERGGSDEDMVVVEVKTKHVQVSCPHGPIGRSFSENGKPCSASHGRLR